MESDQERQTYLLGTFKAELDEAVALLNRRLLGFEQGGVDDEELREVLRTAHNVKGAAAAMGLEAIQVIVHSLESVFSAVRKQTLALSGPAYELCYGALDLVVQAAESHLATGIPTPVAVGTGFQEQVETYLREAVTGSGPGAALPSATDAALPRAVAAVPRKEGAPPGRAESLRVTLPQLDRLSALMGELLITKSRDQKTVEGLASASAELGGALKRLSGARTLQRKLGAEVSPELQRFLAEMDGLGAQLKRARSLLDGMARRAADDELRTGWAISSLRDEVQGLRLQPMASLFEPLRRQARDLAQKHHKKVAIEFQGGATMLDKTLMDAVRDPLVHLLRNSIDHGLETPEQRVQQGKPAQGTIVVLAEQRGGQVHVEVRDDGAGIREQEVRARAQDLGLLDARGAAPTREETLELIFRPGFSTRTAVSETSGRGVGLDVVRTQVEKAQGQVHVVTEEGRGTSFRISLPLTLSTVRALKVVAGGQGFAVPTSAIDRTVRIRAKDVYALESRRVVNIESVPVSVLTLSEALGMAPAPGRGDQTAVSIAVILVHGNERVALMVDDLEHEEELVIKPLGRQLRRVRLVSGGTVAADGSVLLLLNPAALLGAARGNRPLTTPREQSASARARAQRILVVDDSITTRTLEKSILEAAGYEVVLAVDGVEGLALARTSGCDLVITDVEMPRMDGFQLARKIRSDDALRRLPLILVTSLDSPEQKVKGADSGADAYVVKSQFEQARFLQLVSNLLPVTTAAASTPA